MKCIFLAVLGLFVGIQTWATPVQISSDQLENETRNLEMTLFSSRLQCDAHLARWTLQTYFRGVTGISIDRESSPVTISTVTPAGSRRQIVMVFQLDPSMNRVIHLIAQIQTQGTLAEPNSQSWSVHEQSSCTLSTAGSAADQPQP